MKSKRLLSVLIVGILFVCFIFTGCAEISFTTYHNDDGSIVEQVCITIDERELSSYSYNVVTEENKISTDVRTRLLNLVQNYNTYLQNRFSAGEITKSDYELLAFGVTPQMSEGWENGTLIAELIYSSADDYHSFYKYLNGGSSSTATTRDEEKHLLYTKTTYTGNANYGDFALYNEVYTVYAESRFSRISPEATTLYYNYAVSSKRIHSDADSIYLDNNGNYIHCWKINPNEPSRVIHLYTIKANPSYWILICMGISLTICLITVTILVVKQKIKSNKEKSQIE